MKSKGLENASVKVAKAEVDSAREILNTKLLRWREIRQRADRVELEDETVTYAINCFIRKYTMQHLKFSSFSHEDIESPLSEISNLLRYASYSTMQHIVENSRKQRTLYAIFRSSNAVSVEHGELYS